MSTVNTHNLPADLRAIQLETEEHARSYGLDFYPTIFEVLDYDELNAIAAYGGFPTRYPHWRFGMEYEQLSKGYRYGLQKIYEMVINNDPCYAYLLRCNATDRSEAGDRPRLRPLRLLQEQHLVQPDQSQDDGRDGQPRQPHPPLHGPVRRGGGRELHRRLPDARRPDRHPLAVHQAPRPREPLRFRRPTSEDDQPAAASFSSKDYMDPFINPPDVLEAEAAQAGERQPERQADVVSRAAGARRDAVPAGARPAQALAARRAVDHPRRGLLLRPAGPDQDHERRLGQLLALDDHDPAGPAPRPTWSTTPTITPARWPPQPGRLNPYKLGIELFRDIEDRWNKGQFGQEYDECDDYAAKRRVGHAARPGPGEDLRGPADPQRPDVHRHVPDARLLPRAQDVLSFGYNDQTRRTTRSKAASSRRSSSSCSST